MSTESAFIILRSSMHMSSPRKLVLGIQDIHATSGNSPAAPRHTAESLAFIRPNFPGENDLKALARHHTSVFPKKPAPGRVALQTL
jgi:hypothetical protein